MELTSKDIKIYFDMDGVLVDFNGGVEKMCGIIPQPQGIKHRSQTKENEMWDAIRNVDHFYSKLEPIEGGLITLEWARERYGKKNVEILTGVPKPDKEIAFAVEDKREWIKKHVGDDIVVNTVLRADKVNFAKHCLCILIDDHPGNIKAWGKAGGSGILYRNSLDTQILIDATIDTIFKHKCEDPLIDCLFVDDYCLSVDKFDRE